MIIGIHSFKIYAHAHSLPLSVAALSQARAERVERIKRGSEAQEKFKTNEKKFKEGLADLESILATGEDKYKSNPAEAQEEVRSADPLLTLCIHPVLTVSTLY